MSPPFDRVFGQRERDGPQEKRSKNPIQVTINGLISMKITRIFFRCTLLFVFLSLAGCAGPSNGGKNKLLKLRALSNFEGAAQLYLTKDQKPNYNANDLQQTLEAAKAFHDAGRWKESNEAFARAHT